MKQVQELLKEKKLDYLLIDNPLDVFYLTGKKFSRARLVIGHKEEVLFLDGRYLDSAKKEFPCEALSDKNLLKFIGKKSVGFDSIFTCFSSYQHLVELGIEKLIPWKNPLKSLRMVKTEEEIKKLKVAASLNYKAFEYAKELLQEDLTEIELAKEIEIFYLKHGAEGSGFDPIVAYGKNSAYPHYHPDKIKLKKGEGVLFDMGCIKDSYHSDMTRMVFFPKANEKHYQLFQHVKKAYDLAFALCKPGEKLGRLDEVCLQYFKEKGLSDLVKHSLGHGVGLEIHEAPYLKFKGEDQDIILKEGMVFTIEPGLYKEGLGGARYENTVYLSKTGVKSFYQE